MPAIRRRLVAAGAVAAVACGAAGCGDEDAPRRAARTTATASTASAPDDAAYATAVRAAFQRISGRLPTARDTFNNATDMAQARRGLQLYEQAFAGLVADLQAAEPPPSRLAQRHSAWLTQSRRMRRTYAEMASKAHGSLSEVETLFAPQLKAIQHVSPRWADTGDALLGAL
jgi:hypothetical protein